MNDSRADILDLIADSHYLVDTGNWDELVDRIFAVERDGVVPVADFGFDAWRGSSAIRAGYARSLPRFEAAVHAYTNVKVTVGDSRADARYYLLGWHWFAPTEGSVPPPARNADYLILGVMNDEFVCQDDEWRLSSRRLQRLGPGPASGELPLWLADLGESRVT